MTAHQESPLSRLPSGVPGLDDVLGGGLPEYSFNLIAGEPGSGKTTLAQQIVFANASSEKRAIYFTVLGEPALKMLRYMRQMSYFDAAKVGECIRFVDLSQQVLTDDINKVLEAIVAEVKSFKPEIVVVDSFRTVVRTRTNLKSGDLDLQAFLQRLALHLASWQATTFLVGEYLAAEMEDNPIFTIADSILWLSQSAERNSIVRKLQVMKLRGQASMPGLHTFRVDATGLHVFPRILQPTGPEKRPSPSVRRSSGIPALDELLHGGFPAGDAILLAGPSGSGKTCLSTQFLTGMTEGERAVLVTFEEHPRDYIARAASLGLDLDKLVKKGALRVISLRPLDLSVDETLLEIRSAVLQTGASRLVIDSLTGFELALAPAFRDDFRESLYRMVGSLSGGGVTILLTLEVLETWSELRFSPHAVSFLTENILLLRYAEIEGELRKVIAIVKMRRSSHSRFLHAFEIGANGVVIGEALTEYNGVLTGAPKRRREEPRWAHPGLTDAEERVLEALSSAEESDVEALSNATGLRGEALSHALGRLLALNYAIEVTVGGEASYRSLARALGH